MVRVRLRLQASDTNSTTRRTLAIRTKMARMPYPTLPDIIPWSKSEGRVNEQENPVFSFCLRGCVPGQGAYDNDVPKPARRPQARLDNAFDALRGERDPRAPWNPAGSYYHHLPWRCREH